MIELCWHVMMYDSLQFITIHYNSLHFITIHYNSLQLITYLSIYLPIYVYIYIYNRCVMFHTVWISWQTSQVAIIDLFNPPMPGPGWVLTSWRDVTSTGCRSRDVTDWKVKHGLGSPRCCILSLKQWCSRWRFPSVSADLFIAWWGCGIVWLFYVSFFWLRLQG